MAAEPEPELEPERTYKIIEKWQYHEVQDEVNRLIGNGWEPLGGFQANTVPKDDGSGHSRVMFYQAMIKK